MPGRDSGDALNEILDRVNTLIERYAGGARLPEPCGDVLATIRQSLDLLDAALARACEDAALIESVRVSASILACAPQSIIACDINGLITVFSPGAEAMLGYSASEMLGKHTPLLIHDRDEVRVRCRELSRELGFVVAPDFNVFIARTRLSGQPDEREWTYVRKDGSRITVLLAATTLRNAGGEIDGYLGVASDITERTLAAAEISRMAHHDQLTRVPNRRLFHDRMQMALTRARRDSARLALMLIDLDGFKLVNDRLGHPVGDLLLKAVARRMQGCLRESDTLARVGGDEFAVILPRVGNEQDALVVAAKICHELNRPFELAGEPPLSISCSVGVAIYPEHGTDEKQLAKNADAAMYVAKANGGNGVQLSIQLSSGASEAAEPALARLTWDDACACGEAALDQGHHELLDRVNGLIDAVKTGQQDSPSLQDALDEFIACMARHFSSEEAVLSGHHYAGLAEHVLLHQRLVSNALELRRRANVGDATLADLVAFLAREVVARHLFDDDRLFFPLLNRSVSHASSRASSVATRDER